MAGRYENAKIKFDKKNKNYYLKTTTYSVVPETDNDIFVITQLGDRLDQLAEQFYKDSSLWWYIAQANGLTSLRVESGTSLRIPGQIDFATSI